MIHVFDLTAYRKRHSEAIKLQEKGKIQKAEDLERINGEVMEAIRTLPDPFWYMFRDKFIRGRSFSDIADGCQITERQCKDLFDDGLRIMVASGTLSPCDGFIKLLHIDFEPYDPITRKNVPHNRRKRSG